MDFWSFKTEKTTVNTKENEMLDQIQTVLLGAYQLSSNCGWLVYSFLIGLRNIYSIILQDMISLIWFFNGILVLIVIYKYCLSKNASNNLSAFFPYNNKHPWFRSDANKPTEHRSAVSNIDRIMIDMAHKIANEKEASNTPFTTDGSELTNSAEECNLKKRSVIRHNINDLNRSNNRSRRGSVAQSLTRRGVDEIHDECKQVEEGK